MFKPGKGVRAALDRDVAQWLEDTMAQINEVYDEQDPIQSLTGSWDDWLYLPDQFGDKAVRCFELTNDNQLRVSLIMNRKDELKVDIREWYVADDE